MKNLILLFISFVILACNEDKTTRMFQPGKEWEDQNRMHINAHGGGILFYSNNYYWYGEHKVAGAIGNTAQVGVHVYSSKDLYNWQDRGIALRVIENDTLHDISKGCILERPKVIFNNKTKKFIMWFHLELHGMGYDAARSGIAIADQPEGPFTFVKSVRPNAGHWPLNVEGFHKQPVADSVKDKYCGGYGCLPAHVDSLNILGRDFEKGQMARDMNLFVDDDGTAYHIYSSEENSTTHISELTDDYLDYSGRFARIFINRYMEAPTIFKTSEGTYYFMGSDCTGWAPNAARSGRSNSIWGPWTELGNPCIGVDSDQTFHSQSTFILQVNGINDAFIYMGDRWTPENPIDGKYIWLPIQMKEDRFMIAWLDQWNLDYWSR